VLTSPGAWTGLSPEQQHQLAGLGGVHFQQHPGQLGDGQPSVVISRVVNCEAFKADVRMVKEDLAAGRLEPSWEKKAGAAVTERAAGKMDSWKWKEQEAFWGEKFEGRL